MMAKTQKISFRTETVVCSGCGKVKPIYLFVKPKKDAQGHFATCKHCRSKKPSVSCKQSQWGVLVPQEPALIHADYAEKFKRVYGLGV